ncbi:MAG: fatty acid desaturase [Imperialibacter sp.]|uniref:fatty acid desaturase family protein n=1 Tax=Imperialibacter sp. TaxID=2038411 RepID=UPI0032EC538F
MISTAFKKELYEAIDQYFEKNGISRYANGQMKAKLAIAAVWWVGSLVLLYSFSTSPAMFVLLYGFHLFSHLFILLNIAHDANHLSIFENERVRKLLRYTFDLCGINSYMWRQLHNQQHHNFINIKGEDDGLVARGLLRYTPHHEHKLIHRFQHFYLFVVYSFFSLDYIFIKDFECFFFPFLNGLKGKKHPRIEYVKLFVFKLAYIGYVLLLPIYFIGVPTGLIIASFVAWQLVIGVIGATIIQVEHPLRLNEFPLDRDEYDHFIYHVFATTSDHSLNSTVGNWFYGGLHMHVAHHLAPRVCHTHYRELTKLIQPIAEKHGVFYKQNKTIFDAIREHYGHLQNLSLAAK